MSVRMPTHFVASELHQYRLCREYIIFYDIYAYIFNTHARTSSPPHTHPAVLFALAPTTVLCPRYKDSLIPKQASRAR